MRAILVVGMMVATGAVWGQDVKSGPAVEAVANATAGASWCGLSINRAAVDAYLASAGFSRDSAKDSAALAEQFNMQTAFWQLHGQTGLVSPEGKANLSARCAQLLDAFGPDGVIRKGLLFKK